MEIQLEARDKGTPPLLSTTNLTIHVLDTDDQNPVFLHDHYNTSLPNAGDTKLEMHPADLKALDKDIGLNASVFYSFAGTGPIYSYLELNSKTGQLYMTGDPWEVVHLTPVILVIQATQYDNPDR